MRIAFVTAINSWHMPVRTKYLVSKGHKVFYFGLVPGGENSIIPKGVTCIEIKSNHKNKIFRIISKIIQIRALSIKHKIDILHIISMGNTIYSLFSNAKKIIFENNGSDVLVKPEKNLFTKIVYSICYRFLYLFSNAVVQDSKVAQKAGIKYGAPKTNNILIELGIDFVLFNRKVKSGVAKSNLGLNQSQKMVFSPRSFRPNSNIETIINSIPLVKKVFPDVQFVFCRHYGELEENYNKLISSLNVKSNVVFTGFLDNELDMPFYCTDADVVLSVLSSDSSPRSVYEAMACGTPVIISEIPWYHGKFIKDRDLLVVPVRDIKQLAKNIIKVLNKNDTIDLDSAFEKIERNISMIKHSKNLEKLYNKVLSKT